MIMGWRDRVGWLDFVFCGDYRVVDGKESDGGGRWKQCQQYEQIWEIRGATGLIQLKRLHISVITHQIRIPTCCIEDDLLTHTQNYLISHFLLIICVISTHLSLSCPQLYHHLRTLSLVIPLYPSRLWSRVNTKGSIHPLRYTLCTVCDTNCIIPTSTVSRSQTVSHLLADHVVVNSPHSPNYKLTNESSLSSCRASLPNYCQHIDLFQVLLKSCSIMTSMSISNQRQ